MDSTSGKRLALSGAGAGERSKPSGAKTPGCGAALSASLAREEGAHQLLDTPGALSSEN